MEQLSSDPVTGYAEAEANYLLSTIEPEDVFYTRTLERWSEEDFYKDVDLLRGLSYFDVDIAPFNAEVIPLPDDRSEYRISTIEIKGTDNPNMDDPTVARAYDDLSVALLGYYFDRLTNKEAFLTDVCKHTQFVYGSYDTASADRFIFVDLDLMASSDPAVALMELDELIQAFIIPTVQRHKDIDLYAPNMAKDILSSLSQRADFDHLSGRIADLVGSLDSAK